MTGELFINGKDAYTQWGISMESTSLSALMTPPPQKELISNESRLAHGKAVLTNNPKIASREITLALHLVASTEAQFFARYESFCTELQGGRLVIRTQYQPTVYYHCDYLSCTQFTQFVRGIAKFSLKLSEADPSHRTST